MKTVALAFEGLEESLRSNPQYEGDDRGMESKYAGLSTEALLTIKYLLGRRQRAEAERISKERIEAGLFETTVLSAGEKLRLPAASDQNPKTIGFGMDTAGDTNIVRTTAIEPEEYPEYHALLREATWVHRQLHHAQLCDCFQ